MTIYKKYGKLLTYLLTISTAAMLTGCMSQTVENRLVNACAPEPWKADKAVLSGYNYSVPENWQAPANDKRGPPPLEGLHADPYTIYETYRRLGYRAGNRRAYWLDYSHGNDKEYNVYYADMGLIVNIIDETNGRHDAFRKAELAKIRNFTVNTMGGKWKEAKDASGNEPWWEWLKLDIIYIDKVRDPRLWDGASRSWFYCFAGYSDSGREIIIPMNKGKDNVAECLHHEIMHVIGDFPGHSWGLKGHSVMDYATTRRPAIRMQPLDKMALWLRFHPESKLNSHRHVDLDRVCKEMISLGMI